MIRRCIIGVFVYSMIILPACTNKQAASAPFAMQSDNGTQYFRAKHGYSGGLHEMVDLSKREGFDAVRTFGDVAEFASEVPGAVGFTAHPDFENGTRYAHAVVWYTNLSPVGSSWSLYLFDSVEAQKGPGGAPRAEAVAAAEAKVSGKMAAAQQLIDAGGAGGVKLVGDYDEQKVLALAVIRLGGFFEHSGTFGAGYCGGCRSVVPGGNPSRCGLGVQDREHWNCCGGTERGGHCRYWELIKLQDESSQAATEATPRDSE